MQQQQQHPSERARAAAQAFSTAYHQHPSKNTFLHFPVDAISPLGGPVRARANSLPGIHMPPSSSSPVCGMQASPPSRVGAHLYGGVNPYTGGPVYRSPVRSPLLSPTLEPLDELAPLELDDGSSGEFALNIEASDGGGGLRRLSSLSEEVALKAIEGNSPPLIMSPSGAIVPGPPGLCGEDLAPGSDISIHITAAAGSSSGPGPGASPAATGSGASQHGSAAGASSPPSFFGDPSRRGSIQSIATSAASPGGGLQPFAPTSSGGSGGSAEAARRHSLAEIWADGPSPTLPAKTPSPDWLQNPPSAKLPFFNELPPLALQGAQGAEHLVAAAEATAASAAAAGAMGPEGSDGSMNVSVLQMAEALQMQFIKNGNVPPAPAPQSTWHAWQSSSPPVSTAMPSLPRDPWAPTRDEEVQLTSPRSSLARTPSHTYHQAAPPPPPVPGTGPMYLCPSKGSGRGIPVPPYPGMPAAFPYQMAPAGMPPVAPPPPMGGKGQHASNGKNGRAPSKQNNHHHGHNNKQFEEKGYTTIMLRNIPNKYTQEMLIEQVEKKFLNKLDFFYLPIDFTNKCNVGYAFINFVSPVACQKFFDEFNGSKLPGFKSKKVCEVVPARVQGLKANISHFKNSPVMGRLEEQYKPVLFEKGGRLKFPSPDRELQPIRPRAKKQ